MAAWVSTGCDSAGDPIGVNPTSGDQGPGGPDALTGNDSFGQENHPADPGSVSTDAGKTAPKTDPGCLKECSGKQCGDDGCGGSCGACAAGETCKSGKCACEPDCDGKECGDDGCGGSCGACDPDELCDDGECKSKCGECMDSKCGYETAKCSSNQDCMKLLACASGCGSESCIENCVYKYIGGAQDALKLLKCMDASCGSAC
jgi:hypothetical protein